MANEARYSNVQADIVGIIHRWALEDEIDIDAGEVAALQPGSFARLSDAASKAELDVRVFGSWMWQTLTGGSYVNAASDLDVLIDVADAAGADQAADFLRREAAECPFKLDGELSFSGLGEVHWREYLNGEPVILVKSIATVRMVRREELWK